MVIAKSFSIQKKICSISILSLLLVNCGRNEPITPSGIAVWADDGSEIACAINRDDYDGRAMVNNYSNERCNLSIYSKDGTFRRSLFRNRQIDGFTSWIYDIYFMK